MPAKEVNALCTIGTVELEQLEGEKEGEIIECNNNGMYDVTLLGDSIGLVCQQHIHLIDASDKLFRYTFAEWQHQ